MLGSLLRRLTGHRAEPAPQAVPAPPVMDNVRPEIPAPAEAPVETDLLVSTLEAPAGGMGKSPVFSSRAVRDATVVTGTIESLTRFVGGQDVLDDLTWRLESLTPDQVNFLQLSAEPGLIQRAQTRSEAIKGAKAAALRKLLTDLVGGAIPEPLDRTNPLSLPKGPIIPPLTSLQPRSVGVLSDTTGAAVTGTIAPATAPATGTPSLTTAPPLATRPIPPAPTKPVTPPPQPPSRPSVPVTPVAVAPAPTAPQAAATVVEKAPEPLRAAAPPPKPPEQKPVEARLAEPAPAKAPPKAPEAPAKAVEKPAAEPVSPPAPPKPVMPPAEAKAAIASPPPPPPAPVPPAPKAPEPAKAAEPVRTAAEPPKPVSLPAPPAPTPSVPRLGRQDAEARRARLLASLNDTLSSSEAAP